jgi:hypothetical protein
VTFISLKSFLLLQGDFVVVVAAKRKKRFLPNKRAEGIFGFFFLLAQDNEHHDYTVDGD